MKESMIERLKKLNKNIKNEIENINYETIKKAKNCIKNYSQIQIVIYLIKHKNDIVYQKDIGEAVNLKKSSITEHLDYLESIGIIKRIEDKNDSRKKQIVLSQYSLDIEKDFVQKTETLNERMLVGITDEELKVFVDVIDKMEKNLKGDNK